MGSPLFYTGVKICMWYFFSVIAPIINKRVQEGFPFTNSLSVLHLGTATLFGGFYFYYSNRGPELPLFSHSKPLLPPFRIVLRDLLPLGIAKFFGMTLLLFGLKNLPVSLVLTLKALDPLPTTIFTFLILHESESCIIYVTVIPIVFGVILSTMTSSFDAGLQWLAVAFGLVVIDALQNVITKYLLKKGLYTENSLQFLSSGVALLFQLPVCLYYEGYQHIYDALFMKVDQHASGMLVLACTAYYGQVVTAFMVMNQVTNLTYSVANILKRIVQLLTAVIVFNTTIGTTNAMGMLLAMFGVSSYSFARMKLRPPKR